MTRSSPHPLPFSSDPELEAIIRRMGDYKDLVEMADLITTCLSDDSAGAIDRLDSSPDTSTGASSADEAASEGAAPSDDAEDPADSTERSDLVLHLIPTAVPWAMVFLSTFSAVLQTDACTLSCADCLPRKGDGRLGSWLQMRSTWSP